ncbi:MAG: hypothetical protein SF097_01680 [Acidobacteriota bacterium]|nr:hypothetical protein [Acidobacteriota bacterium]
MAGIKKLFADAAKLLYLGVGISDPGTIPRKVDLWKIAAGTNWRCFNLTASNLHHKGKEAVRLEASGGNASSSGNSKSLALFEAVELPVAKFDLSIAAINQTAGLVIRATDQTQCEVVSFDVVANASSPKLTIRYGSSSAEVALPSHLVDEWINVRVVVDALFTAVFINGKNMPDLKVPSDANTGTGNFIGLWASGNSPALVADLKYIQTRKRDFE